MFINVSSPLFTIRTAGLNSKIFLQVI